MPPLPSRVEEEIITRSGLHIYFFTNGAMSICRDPEDPEEGAWLDSIETRELIDGLARNRSVGWGR